MRVGSMSRGELNHAHTLGPRMLVTAVVARNRTDRAPYQLSARGSRNRSDHHGQETRLRHENYAVGVLPDAPHDGPERRSRLLVAHGAPESQWNAHNMMPDLGSGCRSDQLSKRARRKTCWFNHAFWSPATISRQGPRACLSLRVTESGQSVFRLNNKKLNTPQLGRFMRVEPPTRRDLLAIFRPRTRL
jgi:hypothetical protein